MKIVIFLSMFILLVMFIQPSEAQELVCPQDMTVCCEKNENKNSIMCIFHEYETVKMAEQILYNHMNRVIPEPPVNPYITPTLLSLVSISTIASIITMIVTLKKNNSSSRT
ncbi:MAG: hypothetical protein ACE5RC_08765 [Nitrosopumilus sp.]